MPKSYKTKSLISVADRIWSRVRSVRPRVASHVSSRVVLDRDLSQYKDAAHGDYSFVVDKLQLNDGDHMKAIYLSSDNFIEHGGVCKVCQCKMRVLSRVVGKDGSAGLVKSFCPSCTYIRFTRLPSKEWFAEYFAKDFYSGEVERRGVPVPDTTIYNCVKKYIKEDLPVLDIGCGFGEKMKPFADRGFRVFGVEPSRHRASIARDTLGDGTHCLGVEDALINKDIAGKAPFGLCSFYHVLEFCLDPYVVLKDLHELMANNAVLYVSTGLFHTRNIMQESHFPLICSTFNPYSLRLLLRHVGFDIVDMKVTNRGATLQAVALKRSSGDAKATDETQKELQLDNMRRHIRSELDLTCSSPSYEVTTQWSSGSRKAVLTRLPTKKSGDEDICFVHKKTDPIIIVK
jgi:SAM-dependent methyltransferase